MMRATTIGLVLLFLTACQPTERATEGLRVVDADTIEWHGQRYRLANHDAPEIGHARCPHERDLAWRAKHRLETLLSRPYTLRRVPCWGGRPRDRYHRSCALVTVDSRDVGDTLIAEGLAIPWCEVRS
jgi:micrococcal nuclease